METPKSDDPMDLGGFMQNFVLSNPFKDLPGINSTENKVISQSDADDRHQNEETRNALLPGNSKVGNVLNSGGSSPGSGTNSVCPDTTAEKDYVVADENGQVVDTPKAHVGSNVVFAAALKLQKVSGAHAKVQKWLKNNYIYEPAYTATKCGKNLTAEVQEQFPHISNMTLSKIMTFTFPNSNKVTNISGFHGYKGLVAKPQPEDYCHLDLLKAVSHCKLYGSISEAAQLYAVSPDSVASLYYWHPDLSSLPVHMSVAEELQKQVDPAAFTLHNETYDMTHPEQPTRRCKRRTLPADYCDPDTLSDLEDEPQDLSADRLSTDRSIGDRSSVDRLAENDLVMNLKEESDGVVSDITIPGQFTEVNADNHATYSLLRNLLKRPKLTADRSDEVQKAAEVPDEDLQPLDLHTGLTVKSEPVDSGYGDCDGRISSTGENWNETPQPVRRKRREPLGRPRAADTSDTDNVETKLRSEVQRLKSRINTQLAKNQKQEVQLLLAQKDVLSLKSALCTHQVTFTELSQDFANLQDQFCLLNRKFKRALEQLEKDKEETTPVKKKTKRRSAVNGGTS